MEKEREKKKEKRKKGKWRRISSRKSGGVMNRKRENAREGGKEF